MPELIVDYLKRATALEKANAEGTAVLLKWACNQRIAHGAIEHLKRGNWSPTTLGSQDQERESPAHRVLQSALEGIERADAAIKAMLRDPARVSFTDWDAFEPEARPNFL